MAAEWTTFTCMIIGVLSWNFPGTESVQTCTYTIGDKKFSISDWVWSVPDGNAVFSVSFCKQQSNCNGAAICKIGTDPTSRTSIGKKDASTQLSLAADNSGFSAIYKSGNKCLNDTAKNYTSEIYFICGKTLGNLEFVEQNGCKFIFEFSTTEVCRSAKRVNEVPCTIIDRHKKIRDLTQLVKVRGGHQVASSDVPDFYINVCREITGEVARGKHCPQGSSSCTNGKDTGHIVDFSKLEMVNDYTIHLSYANATSGCSTNITFVCPKAVSEIGGHGPVLQSSSLCHYEVLWETEHACPSSDQVSDSCIIAAKDGTFDLRPLKREPGNFYKVAYRDPTGSPSYDYFLNICGEMRGFPCGKGACPFKVIPIAFDTTATDVAACQVITGGESKKTGGSRGMKLRYVDAQLMLIYSHGALCRSGLHRSTIIRFYCNESAGQGTPRFNHEDYCNYFFDWPTSLVCPRARKTGNECRVITPTNQVYDLTALIKSGTENWRADDSSTDRRGSIFMNVCGTLRANYIARNCPADNAACIVSGSSGIGLGKFESKLVSDAKNSLRLVYTNGSVCGKDRRRRSVVTFICHPGQLSNAPVLISKSPDECDYEFVWQTAVACPLGKRVGSSCRVSDPVAGYSFDLTPLSKARPVAGKDYFSQIDDKKEYEYQIKVCKGSSQTKCSVNGRLVGACQYKAATKMAKVMGEAASSLVYFDGLLKLTYRHGDKCRNGQSRETHITFICDENAGIGTPQFEKEVACGTYNFLWYTKHACHSKIVECNAFDAGTNRHYDLSKLSSPHGWQAVNGNRKYYINVCRPLTNRPNGCSIFSAVCDVRVGKGGVETFVQELGVVSDPPAIQSNGDLVIVYRNGSWCGKGKRVTSQIRFICRNGGGEGSPEFDSSASSECSFVFKWETSYACPIGGSVSGGKGTCMVKDPISQYTFNLSPLRRSRGFYQVKSAADTYIINICGNVSGSGCNKLGPGFESAACKFNGQRKSSPSIGSLSQQLTYNRGQITLKYSNGERRSDGYEYETIIMFICNKNAPLGTPSLKSIEKNTFYFEFETSLACSPEPVQCRIAGPGNVMYNLEPLIKTKGYWTALNRETSGQKHHYFINVCQALSESPSACPKDAIAACQVDYNSKKQKGHSIGYITSNPQVKDKTLSIQYRNGEYCHHGKQNRSVQIFFHCSLDEGSPIFQSETKDCRYVFNWPTPAACPTAKADGENCKVEHPVYKHTFDLSKISTREISVNSTKFVISACGITDCGNFGACLKSGTTSTNIGNVNGMLHLLNGDLYTEYQNDNTTTNVRFVCDKNEGLSFVTNANGRSLMQLQRYEFEWKTPLACLPHYQVECSLFLNGNNEDEMYDLSVLSRWDNNWRAQIDNFRGGYPVNRKIFINVCRNIVNRNGAENCPHESGICMIRGAERLNLGSLVRSPYKDGDHIVLEYANGGICKGSKRFSAKIWMKSKVNQVGLGAPILTGVEDCVHTFSWTTSAAKPINTKKQPSGTDCKVVNPLTGNVIDLAVLQAKTEVKVEDGRGGYFMVGVCSSFKNEKLRKRCGTESGVCRLVDSDSESTVNSGNFNQKIIFDKVLTLKYSDGDICPKCNCPRETIITFVCAPDEGDGHPILMSQIEDCTQIFVWRTNHVCEKEVQCTAFGNLKVLTIDNLAKSNGNIEVETESPATKYYINICRSLVYNKDNPCPAGVAACKVTTVKGKKIAQIIGKVTAPPVMNDDKTVMLTYDDGENCASDNSKKWKTVITFVCEQGKMGKPVLKSCDKCVCNFEWKTYEACDEVEKIDEKKCTIIDETSNRIYDLSPLRKPNNAPYKVNSKYAGISYLLNVCGVASIATKNCKNSGVCRSETVNGKTLHRNLGLVKYQRLSFDKPTDSLILKYLQDAHGEKPPVSNISFECDELIGNGQPRLITDVQSHSLRFFLFHWRTSIVCATGPVPLATEFNGDRFSLKKLSSSNESFVAEDNLYKYTVNFFGGMKLESHGCPKTAAVCRTLKRGDEVLVLAPASTQKLSANSTSVFIDYTGGKSSCSNTKVRIVVRCVDNDKDDKKLILKSFDEDQCYYLFVFNAKLICKEDHHHPSQLPGDKRAQALKKHPAAIATVVILAIIILAIVVYFLSSSERRSNAVSSLRYNCKKYVCCKGIKTPGYKYRKVQVMYGDEDIEEREGILEDTDARDDNIYKDSDCESDDDGLLPL